VAIAVFAAGMRKPPPRAFALELEPLLAPLGSAAEGDKLDAAV
jgi:hypothetical protein